jgi:hypothetical protein
LGVISDFEIRLPAGKAGISNFICHCTVTLVGAAGGVVSVSDWVVAADGVD